MNKDLVLGALDRLERQLDVADGYAKDDNKDKLPSVWQIQNGHLRDYVKQVREAITEDRS